MYVITDIEWAVNKIKYQSLTQIAATVVDEQWNPVATYSSLIRPQNASFEDWTQVCYNGAKPEDFRRAPSAFTVLKDFEDWLEDDDILLFWFKPSCEVYKLMHKILYKTECTRKCIAVAEYVTAFIGKKQSATVNPYQLATKQKIGVPLIEHSSKNDVRVVLSLIQKAKLQQEILLAPPPKVDYSQGKPDFPFVLDLVDEVIHKLGCSAIPMEHELKGYSTIESPVKKNHKGCSVCGMDVEMKKGRFRRNLSILERTQYNYVYLENSKIFHSPSCHLIWNTTDRILGAVNFDTVWKTGRTPCKICKPSQYDPPKPLNISSIRIGAKKSRTKPRATSEDEKRAIGRYKQAKEEREAALKDVSLTEAEKNDIYTLTQPEYAFWTAKGYRTFHIRSCAKLANMRYIKGFKYYDQAVSSGYSPCKLCKPTAKYNTKLSIPLANRHREDDSIENLISLCENAGYTYKEEGIIFTIETKVGKWKIYTQVSPIKVDHKNLVGGGGFHRQPRVFLSLHDTFQYIDRHDTTIQQKMNAEKSANHSGFFH